MNAMLHHYEELEQLQAFFQTWYGRGWEGRLIKGGQVSKGEISHALLRQGFTKRLLLRLRFTRELLLAATQGAGVRPAKPTTLAKPAPAPEPSTAQRAQAPADRQQ